MSIDEGDHLGLEHTPAILLLTLEHFHALASLVDVAPAFYGDATLGNADSRERALAQAVDDLRQTLNLAQTDLEDGDEFVHLSLLHLGQVVRRLKDEEFVGHELFAERFCLLCFPFSLPEGIDARGIRERVKLHRNNVTSLGREHLGHFVLPLIAVLDVQLHYFLSLVLFVLFDVVEIAVKALLHVNLQVLRLFFVELLWFLFLE